MYSLPNSVPPLVRVLVVVVRGKKLTEPREGDLGAFLPAFDSGVLTRSLTRLASDFDRVELHPSIICAKSGSYEGLSIEDFTKSFESGATWAERKVSLENFGFTSFLDDTMLPPREAVTVVMRGIHVTAKKPRREIVCDNTKQAESRARMINDIGRHAFNAALRHWPRAINGQFYTKNPTAFCPPELKSRSWNLPVCFKVYQETFNAICETYLLTPDERPTALSSKEFNRKLQA